MAHYELAANERLELDAWTPPAQSDEQTASNATRLSQRPGLTVPVFFNAWRYEKEPHLIVPLLKTAQMRLTRLARERKAVAEQARSEMKLWQKWRG